MQSKRVLVVDDDPKIIAALTANLGYLGDEYIIESSDNATDAIAKIQNNKYILVITDIYMPGVDGWELIKRIRIISPKTQIILLTGYQTPEVESKAKEFKITHCIAKPFRGRVLLNAAFEALRVAEAPTRSILGYSDDFLDSIQKALVELRQKTGARCIMLADAKGSLISHEGQSSGIDIASLLALVAGEFATAAEISRCLGDKHALNLNFHEGSDWDFYSTSILNELVMILLFDRKTQQSRIGMVWLFARQTMEAISDYIRADAESHVDTSINDEFKLDLVAELDHYLGEKPEGVGDTETTQEKEMSDSHEEFEPGTERQQAITINEAQALGIIPSDMDFQISETDLDHDDDEPQA